MHTDIHAHNPHTKSVGRCSIILERIDYSINIHAKQGQSVFNINVTTVLYSSCEKGQHCFTQTFYKYTDNISGYGHGLTPVLNLTVFQHTLHSHPSSIPYSEELIFDQS